MDSTQDIDDVPLHGTISTLNASGDTTTVVYPQPTQSPDDPLNWPLWRKIISASVVLLITAFVAATSNSFGAAGTALNDDPYDISWNAQNTAAGVLFLAIGYGTLLLSSAPWLYGRRISYLVCLVSSVIGNIWFARIKDAGNAIGSQLFVGASQAVAEATVQLSLFDLFFQHQRGLVLGLYVLATSVGTYLGPLISGYIADSDFNWPWVGWFAAIFSGFFLLLTYFGLEETMFERDIIISGTMMIQGAPESYLRRDDQEKRSQSTDKDPAVVPAGGTDPSHIVRPPRTYSQRIALITPSVTLVGWGVKQYFFRMWNNIRIFWFPAVAYAGIQWGFQDAWLTFYLTAEDDNWTSPPYNYGDAKDAIMNVPTLVGAVIGCVYGGYASDVFVRYMARRNGGVSEAEHRLWLMFLPSIICPVGLIIFGVATNSVWPWPAAYVALGFIGFGWGCAGDLSLAYAMDAYPDAILEGMVGVSVVNNTLACVFTFVCSDWMDVQAVSEVFIIIGIIAFVVMLPLTGLMIYYGKRLRRWTTPNYEKFLRARG